MRNISEKWLIFFTILSLLVLPCLAQPTSSLGSARSVGFRIQDLSYPSSGGTTETLTTAFFYPTAAPERDFVLPSKGPVPAQPLHCRLAPDAPVEVGGAPYPLVLFIHGAYGGAINGAAFCKALASYGYVVAATDYIDTRPPDFREQIAFSRLRQGNTLARFAEVFPLLQEFGKALGLSRPAYRAYLERQRMAPARLVLDQLLAMNQQSGSFLYHAIDPGKIGAAGHSLGGSTIAGLTGLHPSAKWLDKRIRAALIFSSTATPFETETTRFAVPVLTFYGDNDPPLQATAAPRSSIYTRAKAPRYEGIVRGATHFSFGNPPGPDLDAAARASGVARVMRRYGVAFFDRYLKGFASAAMTLEDSDPQLWRYRFELKGQKERVFGVNPPEPAKALPAFQLTP